MTKNLESVVAPVLSETINNLRSLSDGETMYVNLELDDRVQKVICERTHSYQGEGEYFYTIDNQGYHSKLKSLDAKTFIVIDSNNYRKTITAPKEDFVIYGLVK